jgi:hypothetical protein
MGSLKDRSNKMKKLVMTAAVLACAATVASAATVTSANIVGYAKNTQPTGGFSLVAPAQFAGTAGEVALADAFGGIVGGEQVYVYNGTAYNIYTYYPTYGGWFTATFASADEVVLEEGAGVWLKGAGGSEAIMAGEVPSATSVTNSLVAGFNLIANPYPVEITLGELDTTNLSATGGEKVYVFNGTAYNIYTYYPTYGGWFTSTFGSADTVAIGVGEGFWLSMLADGDLVFDKQY